MNEPFADQPVALVVDGPRAGAADSALVREELTRLIEDGPAVLNLAEALPTAAFSRRDQLLPGYADAERLVAERGFQPMVRPVGGHLAVYGEGSLVLHHWARHPEPRSHIKQRFMTFGDAIAGALRSLGVDARVGAVPGEYCDGEYSVNEGGRTKLVGTGQRIVKAGFLFSAVIMVHSPAPAREALTAAYRALVLDFDPATVGSVADAVPGVTVPEVRDVVVTALSRVLPVDGGGLLPAGSSARSWTPTAPL